MKTATPSLPTRASREIRDLGAAAYLVCKGHRLVSLKPDGRGYAAFIFDVDEAALLGYLQDDDPVPPRRFLDTLRSLKALAGGTRNG